MNEPKIYVGSKTGMTEQYDVYVFTDKKPSEIDLTSIRLKFAELSDRKRFQETKQEIRPKRKRINQ